MGEFYQYNFWGIHFRYNPVMTPTLGQYEDIKNVHMDSDFNYVKKVGIWTIALYLEIFFVIIVSLILIYTSRTKKNQITKSNG